MLIACNILDKREIDHSWLPSHINKNNDYSTESSDFLNCFNNPEVEKQILDLPAENTIASITKGSINYENQQCSNESQYNYISITNTNVNEMISLQPEELESGSDELTTEKSMYVQPNRERNALPSVSRENSPVPGPSNQRHVQSMPPVIPTAQKTYDYLLKVLLVGDSDVGKQEIISDMEDGTTDSPFCSSAGAGITTKICPSQHIVQRELSIFGGITVFP